MNQVASPRAATAAGSSVASVRTTRITPSPPMPGPAVAQPGHLLGGQLVLAVGVGDQHEVVLGAVALDEGVLAHATNPVTGVGFPGRPGKLAPDGRNFARQPPELPASPARFVTPAGRTASRRTTVRSTRRARRSCASGRSSCWASTARRGHHGLGVPRLRAPTAASAGTPWRSGGTPTSISTTSASSGPVALDLQVVEEVGVGDEPGASVDPQRVAAAGDHEEQADVRVLQDVAVAVRPPVAGPLGDRDRVLVDDVHQVARPGRPSARRRSCRRPRRSRPRRTARSPARRRRGRSAPYRSLSRTRGTGSPISSVRVSTSVISVHVMGQTVRRTCRGADRGRGSTARPRDRSAASRSRRARPAAGPAPGAGPRRSSRKPSRALSSWPAGSPLISSRNVSSSRSWPSPRRSRPVET